MDWGLTADRRATEVLEKAAALLRTRAVIDAIATLIIIVWISFDLDRRPFRHRRGLFELCVSGVVWIFFVDLCVVRSLHVEVGFDPFKPREALLAQSVEEALRLLY